MISIPFKFIDKDATPPQKAHDMDAGFDMTALTKVIDETDIITYGTGIAVNIPHGYLGMLFPRSSVFKKHQTLANCVGVIDAGYTGEILFKFRTLPGGEMTYNPGDRIGQLVVVPIAMANMMEVDELEKTKRSNNGFGSTGK